MTAPRGGKSERSVNVRAAAQVPQAAAKPFGARPAAATVQPAPQAAQRQAAQAPRAGRTKLRAAVRSAQAKRVRSESRRMASTRRLPSRASTVALTREVPAQNVERPAGDIAAAAPTGSIHSMVTAAAERAGVDPELGHAVVKVESMYRPKATGQGGFIGLMQLSYQTARGMGFRGSRQALYEPSANLQYGMRYLAEAVRKAGGHTCGAVSKYQGGHAVRGVTRAGAVYCAKVRRYMAQGSSSQKFASR